MSEKRGTSFKFINSKRGQVTIFIILGVIIVGAAALVYFLYPQIKSAFLGISDPQGFIQNCVQDKIKTIISNLSMQGGSLAPQNYYPYYNEITNKIYTVDYLCYNNQDYLPCVMQQPLLQQHVGSEIQTNLQSTADSCFADLQKNYQNRGYTVDFVKGSTIVDILPGRVVVTFNNQLTLTKDTTQRYGQFKAVVSNNLYDFLSITSSILNWEATYGDAPAPTYMLYYHDLIVEKKEVGARSDPAAGGRNSDGTKIYILTNINTGEMFQFATRGFVIPPGF
jgi:hypothetical protein